MGEYLVTPDFLELGGKINFGHRELAQSTCRNKGGKEFPPHPDGNALIIGNPSRYFLEVSS